MSVHTKKVATTLPLIHDKKTLGEWPADLKGLFDIVVVDEAHRAKTVGTNINVTLQWLRPAFIVLMTATPLPTGGHDVQGYLALIKGKDAPVNWTEEVLRETECGTNINPFLAAKVLDGTSSPEGLEYTIENIQYSNRPDVRSHYIYGVVGHRLSML